MSTAAYRVDLDCFSGPIDLLLYLVRRSELEAQSLTLSSITQQFRETIDALDLIGEQLSLDLAGEFVVTIATLLEIKGQRSLPQEAEEEVTPDAVVDDAEPNPDLIARLVQFKQFRDVAGELRERATRQSERYARVADDRPPSGSDPTQDRVRGIEVWDLLSAFSRIAATQLDRGAAAIRDEEVPVHVYVDQVAEQVRAAGSTTFTELFRGENSRSRVVGIFLAILELVRHHRFKAEQPVDGGEITISPPDETAANFDKPREESPDEDDEEPAASKTETAGSLEDTQE